MDILLDAFTKIVNPAVKVSLKRLFYKFEGLPSVIWMRRDTKKSYTMQFKKLMNCHQSFAQTEYNLAIHELQV